MNRIVAALALAIVICTSVSLGIASTGQSASAQTPDASTADLPDGEFFVREFIAALSRGDADRVASLIQDDGFTFFEPNGNGSFGVVGKAAFVAAIPDILTSGFHSTVLRAQVHGDRVTGALSTSDDDSKAAGVSRYIEFFDIKVVDGKIASINALYDTTDGQTAKYLAAGRAEDEGSDDGPPPDTIEIPLSEGPDGSQPGSLFLSPAADGVSFVFVHLQPGPAGAQQVARLHDGSCATPGETVYPLAAVVDGGSFTLVSATVGEILAKDLTLEVQQVGSSGRVNACAEVLAAVASPPPPAPVPPAPTGIKPPSTGMGPSPVAGTPSGWVIALALMGGVIVLGGVRVGRVRPQ